MDVAADIARIIYQEQQLVLPRFDETVAFELGSKVRELALAQNLSLVVDIRTWDRQMFFSATAGTSADNAEWVRRKVNTVRRFQRASYRSVLERGEEGFRSAHAIDPQDYVLAGGGFPLRVSNAGIIGCLTVSGLPQRQDHEVGVEALCQHLGLNVQDYALALE